MFRDCLSPHGESVVDSIRGDIAKKISEDDVSARLSSWAELEGDGEEGAVALKNLEGGDDAIGLAARWTSPGEVGLKKLRRMQEYLPESVGARVGKVISQAEERVQILDEESLKEESQGRSERGEETDEDRSDDKGITAHRIFAGSSFVQSERSPSVPVEEESRFYTPVSSPRGIQDHKQPFTASPSPPSRIFDQEYSDWFTPITPTKERVNPLPKTPEPKKTMNVLLSSTNKVDTVRRPVISKPTSAAAQSPASLSPILCNLAPAPSSGNASLKSTLSSSARGSGQKTPPSPNTIARREKRRAEREERRRIALKLGRARPDLVSEGFMEKFLTS